MRLIKRWLCVDRWHCRIRMASSQCPTLSSPCIPIHIHSLTLLHKSTLFICLFTPHTLPSAASSLLRKINFRIHPRSWFSCLKLPWMVQYSSSFFFYLTSVLEFHSPYTSTHLTMHLDKSIMLHLKTTNYHQCTDDPPNLFFNNEEIIITLNKY